MAKKRCRRVKSGPRKGRCRLKKRGARRGTRRRARRGTRRVVRRGRKKAHCVKLRGKKRAVRCYSSAKAALKKAARLRAKGKDAHVRGGSMV